MNRDPYPLSSRPHSDYDPHRGYIHESTPEPIIFLKNPCVSIPSIHSGMSLAELKSVTERRLSGKTMYVYLRPLHKGQQIPYGMVPNNQYNNDPPFDNAQNPYHRSNGSSMVWNIYSRPHHDSYPYHYRQLNSFPRI